MERGWGERKEEEAMWVKRYHFCKRKSAVESSQPHFLEKPVPEPWRLTRTCVSSDSPHKALPLRPQGLHLVKTPSPLPGPYRWLL